MENNDSFVGVSLVGGLWCVVREDRDRLLYYYHIVYRSLASGLFVVVILM